MCIVLCVSDRQLSWESSCPPVLGKVLLQAPTLKRGCPLQGTVLDLEKHWEFWEAWVQPHVVSGHCYCPKGKVCGGNADFL